MSSGQSKTFRIAFYCSSLSWGGLEMNTLRHAKWMKERGHHLVLICIKDSALHQAAENSELVIRLVKRNKKNFDFNAAFKLKKLLIKETIEVVWFRDKRDLSTIGMAKTFSFNSFKVLYHQAMQIGVDKKHFVHTIRFKKIDAWIAPLNYLKDQIITKTKFNTDKVHVIPLAIDRDRFQKNGLNRKEARKKYGFESSDTVVGIIGRIDPHKAQQFVKNSVVKMRKDFPNLKLLIVGNKTEGEWGDYYNNLKQEVDAIQDNSVQLSPFIEDVASFYNAIDIFVMSSAKETFGMVTIEAMMAGKKIAGSNTCGTQELLNKAEFGYYFTPNDEQSFKFALTKILNSPKEAAEKALRAKSYAQQNFDHHIECERIETVLNLL